MSSRLTWFSVQNDSTTSYAPVANGGVLGHASDEVGFRAECGEARSYVPPVLSQPFEARVQDGVAGLRRQKAPRYPDAASHIENAAAKITEQLGKCSVVLVEAPDGSVGVGNQLPIPLLHLGLALAPVVVQLYQALRQEIDVVGARLRIPRAAGATVDSLRRDLQRSLAGGTHECSKIHQATASPTGNPGNEP
jgi:hypothetical protein